MIASNVSPKKIVQLHVNEETHNAVIRSADTLLHTLREQLGLTAAKPTCENGDCGVCTVIIDGQPIHSCLSLTIETVHQGSSPTVMCTGYQEIKEAVKSVLQMKKDQPSTI